MTIRTPTPDNNNYAYSREVKMKEILKAILEELCKDGIIDCNQYQGEDFDSLLKRVKSELEKKDGP